MSAASLPMPIDPARTDADWTYDIAFYLDDLGTPEAWDGYTATLALVPRPEALRASDSFLLTSEAAGGLEMLANGVAIRVPAAAMADRAVATYDFELRRHKDGAIDDTLVGSVAIQQGLSHIVGGQLVAGAMTLSGGQGGVKVVRTARGVRVVRAGGAQGDTGRSAYQIAVDNGFVGTEEEWAASLYAPSNEAAQTVFDQVEPLAGDGEVGDVFARTGPGPTDYAWLPAADVVPLGAGLHVRPMAHGTGSGANWANAMALPSALASTRDIYLRADEGPYVIGPGMNTLALTGAGTSGAPRVVGGRDRYGVSMLAVFIGSRDAYPAARNQADPAIIGYDALVIAADYLNLRNISLLDQHRGIQITGNRVGVTIDGVTMDNVDTGVTNLAADGATPLGTLTDFVLRNTRIVGAGIRAADFADVTNGVVEDCFFDGELESYTTTQQGLHLTGACNGVVVRRCTATRMVFFSSNPNQYANGGDGFCDERGCSNITYENCTATYCSDGGFDLKSVAPVLIGCVSSFNKKSYRLWDDEGTLTSCQSHGPVLTLGTGAACHYHFLAPPAPGATRYWNIASPVIRAAPGNLAPLFENGAAVGDPLVINITGYDVVKDPDAAVLSNAIAGSVTVNWNPSLPVTPAFTLTWRAGFEGGVIPITTAAGTVVADAAITTGAGVLSVKGGNGLLVAVGLTLVVGAIPAGGVIQEMTIRVAPVSGLVKADKLIAVLVPAPALHADFSALLARITVPPSATRQALMNTAISTLAAAGIWALIDNLHVRAAPDAQTARLSWKGAAGDSSGTVGAPTFTADVGLGGVGTAAYWTGAAPAVSRTLDNAHIFAFALGVSVAAGYDVANGSAPNFAISCRSGGSAVARMSATADSAFNNAAAPPGAYIGVRDGAASVPLYQNDRLNAARATPSTVLPVTTTMRYGGTPRMLAIDSDGAALTAGQVLANYTLWRAYLIFIGALTA